MRSWQDFVDEVREIYNIKKSDKPLKNLDWTDEELKEMKNGGKIYRTPMDRPWMLK